MSSKEKYTASKIDTYIHSHFKIPIFHFSIETEGKQSKHVADVHAESADEAVRLKELFLNALNK